MDAGSGLLWSSLEPRKLPGFYQQGPWVNAKAMSGELGCPNPAQLLWKLRGTDSSTRWHRVLRQRAEQPAPRAGSEGAPSPTSAGYVSVGVKAPTGSYFHLYSANIIWTVRIKLGSWWSYISKSWEKSAVMVCVSINEFPAVARGEKWNIESEKQSFFIQVRFFFFIFRGWRICGYTVSHAWNWMIICF